MSKFTYEMQDDETANIVNSKGEVVDVLHIDSLIENWIAEHQKMLESLSVREEDFE